MWHGNAHAQHPQGRTSPDHHPHDVRAPRLPATRARRRRAGYLLKDAPSEKLADAIRGVHQGLRVVDPQLAQDAWGEADPLTDRERQVLRAAEEGLASADIAKRLNLSEGTVRNYLSETIAKLGMTNRIEAARLAR